jgi:osmotically-inducible protein OsmY
LLTHSSKEKLMKTDAHLKADVTQELAWDPAINATGMGVAVPDGVVTLTGHLDSYAEKHAVGQAVHPQITAALTRQVERGAKHFTVEVEGSVVTLQRKVHSPAEHEAAVGAAFSARGVSRVVDKIEVGA